MGHVGTHSVRTARCHATGPGELFVRPRDLKPATPASPGAIHARVTAVRRTGSARRAELTLGDSLPRVEIGLPLDHAVCKGDTLAVTFVTTRLFLAG